MAGKRREWSLLPRVSPFRDDAGMMCGFAVVRRPVGVAVSGGFGCPVVWCAGCARFVWWIRWVAGVRNGCLCMGWGILRDVAGFPENVMAVAGGAGGWADAGIWAGVPAVRCFWRFLGGFSCVLCRFRILWYAFVRFLICLEGRMQDDALMAIFGNVRLCSRLLDRGDGRQRHCRGGFRGRRRLLALLREHEGISQRELADRLGIRAPSASELIERLAADGLVEKRLNVADRRVWQVFLTEKGMRLADVVGRNRRMEADALLAAFSPEERAQLAALLEKLAVSLAGGLEGVPAGVPEGVVAGHGDGCCGHGHGGGCCGHGGQGHAGFGHGGHCGHGHGGHGGCCGHGHG